MNPTISRRTILGLLAGSACVACGATAANAGPLDLMPAFWAIYDDGRDRPTDARLRHLSAGFFEPHAADYRRAGIKLQPARIASWLPRFDASAADVRAVHARFARDYQPHLDAFRHALPDFDPASSPVTLMPSLFNFDAHLEPDGHALPLFFGPDGIVRYHGADADLGVLFSHEMFHCYQGQMNPSMCLDPKAPVFASLWMEGTATYASERLDPDADQLHVLLDDRTLARTDPATLRRVAQALLQRIDATDDASQQMFFSTGDHGGDWPARVGYFVGLQIARRLGTTLSLPQMAALPAPRVREVLVQGLREMVAAGGAGAG